MSTFDDPHYSPRLKAAMEEIKTILNKYDIAGVVALHTPEIISGVKGSPGAGEYLLKLNPSYSSAEFVNNGEGVVIKGKAEHYGGDKDKCDQVMRDTLNMFAVLAPMVGKLAMNLMDLDEIATKTYDAEHGPSTDTPHQVPLN